MSRWEMTTAPSLSKSVCAYPSAGPLQSVCWDSSSRLEGAGLLSSVIIFRIGLASGTLTGLTCRKERDGANAVSNRLRGRRLDATLHPLCFLPPL